MNNTKNLISITSKGIIYSYIIVLVAFVLCQLYSFDKFLILIESFSFPGGVSIVYLLASFIVICEVFALPFLLRLEINRIIRVISMILSWIVPVIWLFIIIWLNFTVQNVSNVGFFGTVIDFSPGLGAFAVGLLLGFLSIWSSWIIWPSIFINTKQRVLSRQK